MKENNDIAGLFRTRLADAKMEVRDDFWAGIELDLLQPRPELRPRNVVWWRRLAAAASVALILGAASAAFWYFSPREEMGEAFDKIAVLTSETGMKNDWAGEKFPSVYEAFSSTVEKENVPHSDKSVLMASNDGSADGEEQVAVRVSITITQQMHAKRRGNNGFYAAGGGRNQAFRPASDNADKRSGEAGRREAVGDEAVVTLQAGADQRKWAFKVGIGTSLPGGNYRMPVTAGITAEYGLNRRLSLESGLLYNCLKGTRTVHTLSVPLRLNVVLASTDKVDLYAMAGGAAEKCVAGAADNGFDAEPVQLSVLAGLGVRYKLSDRFALFAEPSVSHHFETDSKIRTLRTEKPVNMNLLCGVRMTY